MTTHYKYNRQVSPPAPFVYVSISPPDAGHGTVVNVPAQLDTAADYTVIPVNVVEQLRLTPCDQVPVAGLGNHVSIEPMYLAVLQIHDLASIALPVLAVKDEPFALLGRDVLNSYRIVLDGPNLQMRID